MENIKNLKFTHLHLHTEYSLLDGCARIKDIIKRAKECDMDSVAITDHGSMFGVIDFYKEAKKEGIKPIIGCEVYVAERSRFDKESGKDDERYHLVLLAENNIGYQNLVKIVSKSYTEGFYYKPRVDKGLLKEYSEGIIASSACLSGVVSKKIRNISYDEGKKVALEYNEIFGQDNFYLELQHNSIAEQQVINKQLMKMSKETNIPLIITNDVHYTRKEDYEAHDILLCIQTNRTVDESDRMKMPTNDFYFKTKEEIYDKFSDIYEAMENTYKIAQRCNVEFTFNELKLPKFDVPDGISSSEYLKQLCMKGLKERYDDITKDIYERLDEELKIINNMGYVDYFLIVWDFIKYAKDNEISVGPGRGSAAGSLVSYVLKITNIDPLKYDLLFERFLNPERVSMPDIDIDFCYVRRSEVIEYVIKKYGEEKVAQIITFGTMSAKSVIRDVGRALNMSYSDVDKIAKMIPNELKMTLDKALKQNKQLREIYEENEQVKYLIDMAKKLEGIPRHSSTHAAGVVISSRAIDDFVPISLNGDMPVTQFPMTTVEELGLLKMDFLGLRTLTVIKNAIDLIYYNYGIKIDLDNLDIEDEKVYKTIADGKTEGIFQLESKGMTTFMKELKPDNIEDIIAGVSLYRPGPMDFIPKYIKGKKTPSEIEYKIDQLEPILKSTYGCIVYQEQVMQIFRQLGGYSLGRSDIVRRAMGKKKLDVMMKEKKVFIYGDEEDNVEGCVKKGIPEHLAEEVFNNMIDFAKYAFNKSHAACYAVIAYQTAYLKTYYPSEFMAATMSSVMDSLDKVAEYIAEAKSIDIDVMPPNINTGYSKFSVTDGNIVYSLSAIKNVGKNVVKDIVKERQSNGLFKSLTEFCERMMKYGLNKRSVEGLIKAGAFDSLGGKRSQYLSIYEKLIQGIHQNNKSNIIGQTNLFNIGQATEESYEELPQISEFTTKVLLNLEKEVLGIYISGHPLLEYKEYIDKYTKDTIFRLNKKDEDTNEYIRRDGERTIVVGVVSKKTVKITKNGKQMAFVEIEDLTSSIELIVFPNLYERDMFNIEEEQVVIVSGKLSIKEDDGVKILCDKIKLLDNIIEDEKIERKLYIKVKDNNIIKEIGETLKDFRGNESSVYVVKEDGSIHKAKIRVDLEEDLMFALENTFGNENITIK